MRMCKKIKQINNLSIVLNEQTGVYRVFTPNGYCVMFEGNFQDAVKYCESCKTFVKHKTADTIGIRKQAPVNVQIGDEVWAVVKQTPIVYTTAMEDELDYECWKLVKTFAKAFGVKLIDEDGELVEIGFDLAKEIAEVILKQYTRAGIPIVRK